MTQELMLNLIELDQCARKDLHSLHPDPLRRQVVKLRVPTTHSMRDPESFFYQRGSIFYNFFGFFGLVFLD